MRVSKHIAFLLCCIAVAVPACTAVTPAGLIAASRLDPLSAPADEIAVALGVPQSVRLGPGDAVLRIAFRGGAAASTVQIEEEVPLQIAAQPDGAIAPNSPDERVFIASLGPEDAARFSAAQRAIQLARAQGVEGKGTLTAEVVDGCLTAPLAAEFPISTWLRSSGDGRFVPLTRQIDAFQSLGPEGATALRSRLAPC
ncbi:hypothetical protein [Roseibaca sp. Y0-43]|uniref:hypothetical protein n=1 Tax=Roseibaca sp. Y0-43 TaxID=2816854 RepID=UPI001D0C1F80|nr:hypothetical protein [Roseibaca sp. Y0-43]MCC1480443.1 hypothetical protein [Roseibaca sp. Y0-43]